MNLGERVDDSGRGAAVGHVLNTYLGRSATFIYTLLRFQQRMRPVVLARRTENLDEFPIDPVIRLLPASKTYRRASRTLPTWAAASYTRRLAAAASRNGCRILHAHFGWAACDSLAARKRLGAPLVATFYGHDLAPVYAERYPYDRLFAEAAFVCCEGSHMGDSLRRLGCPDDKLRIVKIGLDLKDFPFQPRPRTRPFVVIQAARFVEKKGVDLSIRAFAAARSRLGPSELWLVGDGPERADLETLAAKLGVASDVRFLGMVPHTELREVMRRASVCIQPSRTATDGDTEGGAPTVLLEMQAMGIPVVATRHADIPQVVCEPSELADEGDVDGLASALVGLVEMAPADWATRAKRGRALIEAEHDAPRIAMRVESLYDDALAAHST